MEQAGDRIFTAMPFLITPYQDSPAGKKEQVASMFDRISGKYDFLNHFLSLGIDRAWRKRAISEFQTLKGGNILDVATGTGDLALDALSLPGTVITGIDISEKMLDLARSKVKTRGVGDRIKLMSGDSEQLEFADGSFDGVMVSFGVRNFEHLEKGLSEMFRVLKPGAKAVILEFSQPATVPFKQLYGFYFRYILPFLGNMLSRDTQAYSYLHRSVRSFPNGRHFLMLLEQAGFSHTKYTPLSLGICTIYTGTR